jgi:hypothetical protein
MGKKVFIAAFTIGFLMIPFLIHAEVYKWIDDKGTFGKRRLSQDLRK